MTQNVNICSCSLCKNLARKGLKLELLCEIVSVILKVISIQRRWFDITNGQSNFKENICCIVVSCVPAVDLAPLCCLINFMLSVPQLDLFLFISMSRWSGKSRTLTSIPTEPAAVLLCCDHMWLRGDSQSHLWGMRWDGVWKLLQQDRPQVSCEMWAANRVYHPGSKYWNCYPGALSVKPRVCNSFEDRSSYICLIYKCDIGTRIHDRVPE